MGPCHPLGLNELSAPSRVPTRVSALTAAAAGIQRDLTAIHLGQLNQRTRAFGPRIQCETGLG